MENIMVDNGSVFDFGDGCKKVTLSFDGVVGTSLVELRTDGQDGCAIGVVAMTPTHGHSGESTAIIENTSGVHKIFYTVHGGGVVQSMRFHNEPDEKYIPAKEPDGTYTHTWTATDMLGRKMPEADRVGEYDENKHVGVFYWTWRESFSSRKGVSVAEVLAKSPGAEYDRADPAWGGHDGQIQCHWAEPLYGYYKNSDPYVIRRHASMLAAAGVDFLVFDCTNGAYLWADAYEPLLQGLREAKCDGIKVPDVAFMLNFGPLESSHYMLRALYQNMYGIGKYRDLWYKVDGKPLVIAYSECLPDKGICDFDTKLLKKIRNFFTFRAPQPLYGTKDGGPHRPDHWGWLEIAPQNKYGSRPDGSCEMMTVGVAQNSNKNRICTCFNDKDTFGRSYTYKYGHKLLSPESYKYGYNVQEQWDNALAANTDRVFVTGWNEWCIGLHRGEPWIKDPDSTQLAMVDQYDKERSRDIEPDKDGYLDTYYIQLASNIRRFKGAVKQMPPSEEKTMKLSGCSRQWKDVMPDYRNHKGTAAHRDWDGFAGTHYVNNTGVNDIISTKVARDAENLYFTAVCSSPVKDADKSDMMTLYIDRDRNKCTGWEGYDIRINGLDAINGMASVEMHIPASEDNSFTWAQIGTCKYLVSGKRLMMSVSRELLGMTDALDFEFKWSDNLTEKNAMDFYVNGCTAPIGRFNYIYKVL